MSSSEEYLDSLLAAVNGQQDTEDPVKTVIVEETAAEPVVEEAVIEPVVEEPTGDPNRALSPDEIAAMFAQAETAAEPVAEEVVVEEPVVEEPTGDPNRALSPDEIAAMFAQAEAAAEPVAEEVVIEPVVEEPTGDPNRALSPDEIAAMFAQAEAAAEPKTEEVMVEEPMAEEVMAEEPETGEPEVEKTATEVEMMESAEEEQEPLPIEEEMEIDMEDEEAMSILLGLKERPTREHKKTAANTDVDSSEESTPETAEDVSNISISEDMDLEDILSDLGENDAELQEIGDLLRKSDNHELVDDDLLALLEPDVIETPNESSEYADGDAAKEDAKKREKKKGKKKGLFSFLQKKKENEEEELPENQSGASYDDSVKQEQKMSRTDDSADDVTDFDSMLEMASAQAETSEDEMAFEDEVGIDSDDIQALMEGIPEKGQRKQASKKNSKKKNKKADSDKSNDSAGAGDTEKKQSALGRFFAMLLEEEEESEETEEEANSAKEKKAKKARKGKKKGAVTDANDNEGILEELDAEDSSKKKKKEKKKKDKKNRKVKEKPESQETEKSDKPEKKLPIKMVVRIFVLCFSVMALLLIVANILPQVVTMREARNAFYQQKYDVAFENMTGKTLSKKDQRIYEKTKIIVKLQHKTKAFENFRAMNKPVEALDALLSGYALWQSMQGDIIEYDAKAETDVEKTQIVDALQNDYQLSEEDASSINALDDYQYTKKLEEITGALSMQNSLYQAQDDAITEDMAENIKEEDKSEDQESEWQHKVPTEDVLPEEEMQ